MKIFSAIGLALLTATSLPVIAAAQTNVILNSGFETGGYKADNTAATLGNGNNVGVVPNSWTIGAGFTANNSNLQQGGSTSGTNALAPYNGAYSGGSSGATGGTDVWDGTGTTGTTPKPPVVLTQQFTLATGTFSVLSGSFALGGRDVGSPSVNTSVSLINASGTTLATFTGTTPDSTWTVTNMNFGSTSSPLPGGVYTLSINLADYHNIDAVRLIATTVPEPSTWIMAFVGLGTMLMIRRRQRRLAE